MNTWDDKFDYLKLTRSLYSTYTGVDISEELICNSVLMHTPKPDAVLKEMKRITKNDGHHGKKSYLEKEIKLNEIFRNREFFF